MCWDGGCFVIGEKMILPYVYRLIEKNSGQFYIGYRYKNVALQRKSNEDLGYCILHHQNISTSIIS